MVVVLCWFILTKKQRRKQTIVIHIVHGRVSCKHHRFYDSLYFIRLWDFYSRFYYSLLSLLRCLFLTMRQQLLEKEGEEEGKGGGEKSLKLCIYLVVLAVSLCV